MSRSATIVIGFIENVDSLPKTLELPSPIARVAIAFNTHYPKFKGGYFFDHELVIQLLSTLLNDTQVQIELEGRLYNDLNRLKSLWDEGFRKDDPEDPHQNSLFDQIEARRGGDLLYHLRGIDWHQVGGPEPYHDSATIEILCNENESSRLLKRIRESLKASSCEIHEIKGLPIPKISLTTRIRSWFV